MMTVFMVGTPVEFFNTGMTCMEVDRGCNANLGDSKLHCQSPKSSKAKERSQHFGVRFRPDLKKWVSEIRVAEWKTVDKNVWLGTFDSEEGAARAVDSARKLLKCKEKRPFNFPCDDLNAYSEEIPPHLNSSNLSDNSMFKDVTLFIKRKAQEYATSFCPNKTSCILISSDQVLALDKSLEPSNEEEKFAKFLEIAYQKAVKAGGDSMCPSLEPGGHEWRLIVDFEAEDIEDEELNNGASATDESEAEVTADSPCLETNPKYAGRKRKSIDDDDLVTKLAPFIKQQIEDALTSTLLPLVSVLRSREEDEQKHRETLLALEEEKLALEREKLLFKRRRVALSHPNPRASYSPRSGYKKYGLR